MRYTSVSAADVRATPELGAWECTDTTLVAEFRMRDVVHGAALVAAIAAASEAVDHHPDLTLRFPGVVGVVLTTRATNCLTTADVDLARRISTIARAMSPDDTVGE